MSDGKWHLDKRVPVALIFALAAQFAMGAYWVATTEARLAGIEEKGAATIREIQSLEAADRRHEQEISQTQQQSSILVERLNSTIDSVNRLQGEVEETNDLLREVLRGQ
ncbi:hypothetical protein [Ruegeria jejuensis]|uniref:hypothetical protein n=1 Tax=Ruegeria jejuensis TaxID=3233338 RepID=UPI00355B5B6F